jgi:hypothetical protein
MQDQMGGKSRIEGKSMSLELRQRLYDFIQAQDLQQLQAAHALLYEAPQVDRDWEFSVPPWTAFLLRPPQSQCKAAAAAAGTGAEAAGAGAGTAAGAGAAAGAAAGAGTGAAGTAAGGNRGGGIGGGSSSSRQRAPSRDHQQGQQSRNFDSYGARKAIPISNGSNDTRYLLSVTMQPTQQGKPVGLYRCWVCVIKAGHSQQPDTGNGHDWRYVKLSSSSKGAGPAYGWVDVSVGLGVFEPDVLDNPARKRTR